MSKLGLWISSLIIYSKMCGISIQGVFILPYLFFIEFYCIKDNQNVVLESQFMS